MVYWTLLQRRTAHGRGGVRWHPRFGLRSLVPTLGGYTPSDLNDELRIAGKAHGPDRATVWAVFPDENLILVFGPEGSRGLAQTVAALVAHSAP